MTYYPKVKTFYDVMIECIESSSPEIVMTNSSSGRCDRTDVTSLDIEVPPPPPDSR